MRFEDKKRTITSISGIPEDWQIRFSEIQKNYPKYYHYSSLITDYLYKFLDWFFSIVNELSVKDLKYFYEIFRDEFRKFILSNHDDTLSKIDELRKKDECLSKSSQYDHKNDIIDNGNTIDIRQKDGTFRRYRIINKPTSL